MQVAYRGVVWERTKSWIQAAAEVAPLTTEALLHSFLTSSDALPGATPPAWLANSGHEGLPAVTALGGSAANSSSAVSFGNPAQSGGKQARVATQAALRRAADLLQACAKARRQQQLGQGGEGAFEGALGLTRKLHYTGYVQGLMVGRGSAAVAAPAEAEVADGVDGGSELDSEASDRTQLAIAEEVRAWRLEQGAGTSVLLRQLADSAVLTNNRVPAVYHKLGDAVLSADAAPSLQEHATIMLGCLLDVISNWNTVILLLCAPVGPQQWNGWLLWLQLLTAWLRHAVGGLYSLLYAHFRRLPSSWSLPCSRPTLGPRT